MNRTASFLKKLIILHFYLKKLNNQLDILPHPNPLPAILRGWLTWKGSLSSGQIEP